MGKQLKNPGTAGPGSAIAFHFATRSGPSPRGAAHSDDRKRNTQPGAFPDTAIQQNLGLTPVAASATLRSMRVLARSMLVILFPLAIVGCAAGPPAALTGVQPISFAASDVGHVPSGFTTALTGGGGRVSWVVRSDPSGPGNGLVLVQDSADDTSYRFPMCIYGTDMPADVSVSVKFKAISGSVDQAAGLVLRYSPENYYVARANALEDNVNLFKTVNGNRLKIAEVDAKVKPLVWHTLGFAARGSHLTVTYDGRVVIDATDTTFSRPGKIGLWTKADSVTAFADLRVGPSR